jgi:hypothetical protein
MVIGIYLGSVVVIMSLLAHRLISASAASPAPGASSRPVRSD